MKVLLDGKGNLERIELKNKSWKIVYNTKQNPSKIVKLVEFSLLLEMKTNPPILTRKPYLVLINKKKEAWYPADFAVPSKSENKRKRKY